MVLKPHRPLPFLSTHPVSEFPVGHSVQVRWWWHPCYQEISVTYKMWSSVMLGSLVSVLTLANPSVAELPYVFSCHCASVHVLHNCFNLIQCILDYTESTSHNQVNWVCGQSMVDASIRFCEWPGLCCEHCQWHKLLFCHLCSTLWQFLKDCLPDCLQCAFQKIQNNPTDMTPF